MTMLIVCGQTAEETPEFLKAERALLKNARHQNRMPKGGATQTLHLKELPSDAEGIGRLAKEVLQAFGLENASFRTELTTQAGYPFLVIYSEGRDQPSSPTRIREQVPASRTRKILAGIAVALLLLAAAYAGLGNYLVSKINSDYQLGRCEKVNRAASVVKSLYPTDLFSSLITAMEQHHECMAYTTAESAQQEQDWAGAYAAYREYITEYPDGVLVVPARENAIITLWNLAQQQCDDGQYAEGLQNISTFLNENSTSSLAAEAEALLPVCTIEWGRELQSDQDFAGALDKYQLAAEKDITPNDPDGVTSQAQDALSTLYREWADFLVTQNEFETAMEKYNLAMETDAHPDDPTGAFSQVKVLMPTFHLQWANYLIEQGQFEEAVSHFETYISLVPAKDEPTAREALAEGYLRWAEALRGGSDFWGALDKINLAEGNASGEANRTRAGQVRSETYAAFAASAGSQAQAYMKEVTRNLATKKQTPEYPIIGVDETTKRLLVYGERAKTKDEVKIILSNELLAQTPGQLHYVAYVLEEEEVALRCPGSVSIVNGLPVFEYNELTKIHWLVSLLDALTGAPIERHGFYGAAPTSCATNELLSTIPGFDLNKKRPSIEEVEAWLRTFIQ